jgi:hypothetical protein
MENQFYQKKRFVMERMIVFVNGKRNNMKGREKQMHKGIEERKEKFQEE